MIQRVNDSDFIYERRMDCSVRKCLLTEHQESASSTWGSSYQSGIIAPTGDAETYGANKHYVYKMNWCLKKTSTGWTCQVTDAGWADTGLGVATAAQYAAATVDNISKNTHWVWNQRHNNSYSIYKIVGCST